jgi:hypothetical protein
MLSGSKKPVKATVILGAVAAIDQRRERDRFHPHINGHEWRAGDENPYENPPSTAYASNGFLRGV